MNLENRIVYSILSFFLISSCAVNWSEKDAAQAKDYDLCFLLNSTGFNFSENTRILAKKEWVNKRGKSLSDCNKYRSQIKQDIEERNKKAARDAAIAIAVLSGIAIAANNLDNNYSNRSQNCTYTHNYKSYTIKNPSGFGSCPSYHNYEEPYMCGLNVYSSSPRCSVGKACGDTCINANNTCHVGRGSACNTIFRSYP